MRARGGIAWLVALALVISFLSWPIARAEEPGIAVSVVRAANRCFTNRLFASGFLVATREFELRPEREGLVVSEVLVEPGDKVAKDQVLARLVTPQSQEVAAIKSPAPGVVIAAGAIVGAYTSPGAKDPLFRIAGDGAIDLRAEIVATDLSHLRKDAPAKVFVLGLDAIEGRIVSLNDGVDAQTQLGTLRVSLAADPRLRVGTFARAEIDAGQDCGLTIPLSALLYGPDGAIVGTVRDDRVVMRQVTTGLLEGGAIEIRDGLSENDLVIARAGPFLRDGDRVRPVQASK